jgi:hypothetical protein
VENPIKGRKSFLDAFEVTSRLIQRYSIVERTYHKRFQEEEEEEEDRSSQENEFLKDAITSLYKSVLVYQARVLRHLAHREARRILSNTFKPEQWEELRQAIQKEEEACDRLSQSIDQQSHLLVEEELRKQSRNIEKFRDELEASLKQQLDAIEVTPLNFYLLSNAYILFRRSKA